MLLIEGSQPLIHKCCANLGTHQPEALHCCFQGEVTWKQRYLVFDRHWSRANSGERGPIFFYGAPSYHPLDPGGFDPMTDTFNFNPTNTIHLSSLPARKYLSIHKILSQLGLNYYLHYFYKSGSPHPLPHHLRTSPIFRQLHKPQTRGSHIIP